MKGVKPKLYLAVGILGLLAGLLMEPIAEKQGLPWQIAVSALPAAFIVALISLGFFALMITRKEAKMANGIMFAFSTFAVCWGIGAALGPSQPGGINYAPYFVLFGGVGFFLGAYIAEKLSVWRERRRL